MVITLYQNMSPANYVNKTLQLVDTIDGTLRKPTSIINPVITIARELPTGFNYAQIASFGRYYFVKGIASEYGKLVTISMHVDVLMTYAADIRAARAIVKRNEFKWNLYLDDGLFRSYQNTNHKIIPLPNGFGDINDFSFVLALAGNSE